jgi:hypothetical protein
MNVGRPICDGSKDDKSIVFELHVYEPELCLVGESPTTHPNRHQGVSRSGRRQSSIIRCEKEDWRCW